MTESELRKVFVRAAELWLGSYEADGSHKPIIDLYNSHTPRARGYKMPYTGSWCAAFVSAVAIGAGLTDIIPPEVSCGEQIKLFKKLGTFVEDDAYIPKQGDILYYDWGDKGEGDNTSWPDHVGIVVSCDGDTIKVIEGNNNDAVRYRTLQVNGRYIRGYGAPDFASLAREEAENISSVAVRVKTNADPLNIRTGAGTEYPIIGTAAKGTILLGRDSFDGWRHVVGFTTNGVVLEGWASEQYLEEVAT